MAATSLEDRQPGYRALFRDSYLLHKLHSLSGVFPIGFFMIQHLVANSYSLRGEKEFNTVVSVFGYLPFVAIMEWAIVFLPILFHSIYGFMITAESRGNVNTYNYGRNWLYSLQRWSGVIAFLYIAYHTYSTWGLKKIFELQQSHEAGFRAISYDAMTWRFADWWYLAIYIIGIGMASFHLGNGLFNFGIRWGITIGKTAQRISAALWLAVGFGLFFIGTWTSINFYLLSQHYVPGNAPAGTAAKNIREVYPTLDELVKAEAAPANPVPGAKPVDGAGGVMQNPSEATQPDAGTAPSADTTLPRP